jgi:hypothetical protein
MNIAIQPGVTDIEVDGLYPSQSVTVTAKIGTQVSAPATYNAPAATAPPAAPTVTD